jgi:uncharacterized protein HemX
MAFLLFLKKYWIWIVGALVIFFVLILGAALYSHLKKTPTIDQAQIQKINSADEKEKKQAEQEIVQQNIDVIQSNESNRTLTEANVDERNRQSDQKIVELDKKVAEAKSQGRDVTQEEVQCILAPDSCK